MPIDGRLLIGGQGVRGEGDAIFARDPAAGIRLETPFHGASAAQIEEACALADAAFDPFRAAPLDVRAALLDRIADNIEAIGDELIERAMHETGLPAARLTGERGRTAGQLRLFGEVVRAGLWLDARIDPSLPERQPAPRPDLRLRNIGLGPVAVFGASNFPLAFSVAGGDTASALSAGCPVVVKAHSAHLGTSELVGRAVQAAVRDLGLPSGVFALVLGPGAEIGQALARDRRIKAVGFTGSRAGGLALMATAAARPEPIPVYAEMSSINPVLLMPGALAARPQEIARAFVTSLNMGAGQFCTNPGLVLAVQGDGLDAFVAAAGEAMLGAAPQTMLTEGVHRAFVAGVAAVSAGAPSVAQGPAPVAANQSQAFLFGVDAPRFLADETLGQEVFGPSSVLVRCDSLTQMREVLQRMEGQLTATVQMEPADTEEVRELLPILERKAGRVLVNGFPTGVEVSHAMVHGGPFPSTSDGRSTSVGALAIRRYLRPVCYQDVPAELLPPELDTANSLRLPRLIEGRMASV